MLKKQESAMVNSGSSNNRTAGVQGVQALNTWALAVGAVCLGTAHEDDLQSGVAVR